MSYGSKKFSLYGPDMRRFEDGEKYHERSHEDTKPREEVGSRISKNTTSAIQKGADGIGKQSNLSTAGDMLMAGSGGDPYLAGTGAAIKVIGNVASQRKEERRYNAKNEIKRKAKLAELVANVGSGVGSMGMS